MLDLSHGGDRTILEAVAAAKRPMSIDHTGCRALGRSSAQRDRRRNPGGRREGRGGRHLLHAVPDRGSPADPRGRHRPYRACGSGRGARTMSRWAPDNFLSAHPDDEKTRAATRVDYARRAAAGIAAPGENPDFFPAVRDYNSPLRFRMLADDLKARGWSCGDGSTRSWAETGCASGATCGAADDRHAPYALPVAPGDPRRGRPSRMRWSHRSRSNPHWRAWRSLHKVIRSATVARLSR